LIYFGFCAVLQLIVEFYHPPTVDMDPKKKAPLSDEYGHDGGARQDVEKVSGYN
jgi:hypothetical protein